jgi:phosphonate utilization transcriptional regulator
MARLRNSPPPPRSPEGGARTGPSLASVSGADATHAITLVQSNSLPTLVQRELERMILAGDLAAGQQLREVEVAAMLGVSRGPVREAFRALEESGLVRQEKNRGVYVRELTVREADEIYELRAILDEFVGCKLAQSITPLQTRELKELVTRMDAAASCNDVAAYLDANLEFHDRMVELCGNDKLLLIYRRLVNELHLFRRRALEQGGTLPVSTREHGDIVKLIAEGRAVAAGKALHDHVIASRDRMHAALARGDDRPARATAGRRSSS